MTKICRLFAAVMLFACGCLFAFQAEARVCFATDPECGEGGNFGDMTDSAENLKNMCLDAGYTTLASDCKADIDKQIGEYCPYDHKYVICCGLEYAYSKCTYPLVATGQCGSKYACECNSSQYPYYQKTSYVCAKAADGTEYQNSLASGGSCAYTGYDRAQHSVTHNIRFTECLCDRGLYPKTEEECAKVGAGTYGNECVDSNGDTFFASCICGKEYEIFADSCKYGTYSKDILCQQGDVYKTKRCCECNSATYPYDDYGDLDDTVETYTTCEHEQGCTRGTRYRATSCTLGYKVVNGKCEPKNCGEIIQDYLTDKGITSYSLYDIRKTPSTTNVIVGNDTGYGAKWEHFSGKKVISGQRYAQTINGSDKLTLLMKERCTAAPVIYMSSRSTTPSGLLEFTSVILKGTTLNATDASQIVCWNCGLEFSTITQASGNFITLGRYADYPNTDNMYVKAGTITANGFFVSDGYNFSVTKFKVYNTYGGNPKVIIRGTTGQPITFAANMLSVRGFAMMRYVNATVNYTCLGIETCTSTTASTSVYFNENNRKNTASSLNLYDTNYNIANGGRLYMSSGTKIGQSTKEGTTMPETGRINFAAKTSTNFYMGTLHHRSGWNTAYGSIDQYGSWHETTYTGYGWNVDKEGCGSQLGWMEIGGKSSRSTQPRDKVCYIDYNGNQYKYSGSTNQSCKYYDDCRFGDNDGDNTRSYIRHSGYPAISNSGNAGHCW